MQIDLFGEAPAPTPVAARSFLFRDSSARGFNDLLVKRVAREFAMPSLFDELFSTEPDVDIDYEGCADESVDASLRASNLDLSHCTDSQLERFVREVHIACLEENLDFLQSTDARASVLKEKGYILQWIFCDDSVNGVPQSRITCSFLNCCIASGVDRDSLRACLLQMPLVRDLMLSLHLVDEKKLPQLNRKVMYSEIVGDAAFGVPSYTVYPDLQESRVALRQRRKAHLIHFES